MTPSIALLHNWPLLAASDEHVAVAVDATFVPLELGIVWVTRVLVDTLSPWESVTVTVMVATKLEKELAGVNIAVGPFPTTVPISVDHEYCNGPPPAV